MSATERRAAAQARRAAAEQRGERGGDTAFRQFRASVTGHTPARVTSTPSEGLELRAEKVSRGGKELVHTSGYFTRYGKAYPMWDDFGEYEEVILSGAGADSIAAAPEVAFLVNHTGLAMARTKNGTLELEERDRGGWHDAWLNPERHDVHDVVTAIKDGDLEEMSFAFMIPDGGGMWSEDFTQFAIARYDINRGDVSAVNFGANPYTDIAARSGEILRDLSHLPAGARRAAADMLGARPADPAPTRERIEARGPRVEPVVIARSAASPITRRLRARFDATAARYVQLAITRGMSARDVSALASTQLPWYEIRMAATDDGADVPADTADVYIFDEIGGSMGVNASAFVEEINALDVTKLNVHINSPGGSVFDGITIHSSLLHHPAAVRTYIDGIAASAASVIAMAADPYDEKNDAGGVWVMPGAEMMIHDASAQFEGNPAEVEKMATFLHRQSDNIAGMYAGRAGGTPEEWRGHMQAETWLIGSEAVDFGLADKLYEREPAGRRAVEGSELGERMARRHDVSGRYRYNRRSAAPTRTRGPGCGDWLWHGNPKLGDWLTKTYARRDATAGSPQEILRSVKGYAEKAAADRVEAAADQPTTEDQATGRSIAAIRAQLTRDELTN